MNQLDLWGYFFGLFQELSSETAAVGRTKGIPELAAVASASRVPVRVPGFDSFSCKYYYPGQKNRYSREIHEVDLQFDHVISCDIERRFDIDATRGICASRVALQIEVDVA